MGTALKAVWPSLRSNNHPSNRSLAFEGMRVWEITRFWGNLGKGVPFVCRIH